MVQQYDRGATATIAATDNENAPIIEVGDELTVRSSKQLDLEALRPGAWVIVRSENQSQRRYRVRQYWHLEGGAMLVPANPAMPAQRVGAGDVIDGVILRIRKADTYQHPALR